MTRYLSTVEPTAARGLDANARSYTGGRALACCSADDNGATLPETEHEDEPPIISLHNKKR
jgi:hypothetical protein